MQWSEKLAKLTDGRNKQRLSVEAGLPPTAISDYLAKGNAPRSDKVLALARVLKVPLEWLLDDAQNWPPPTAERQTAATLRDDELMLEVCRRFRLENIRLRTRLDQIEGIDWRGVMRQVGKSKAAELPADVFEKLTLILHFYIDREGSKRYQPDHAEGWFLNALPGNDLPWREVKASRLAERWLTLHERMPGFREAFDFVMATWRPDQIKSYPSMSAMLDNFAEAVGADNPSKGKTPIKPGKK